MSDADLEADLDEPARTRSRPGRYESTSVPCHCLRCDGRPRNPRTVKLHSQQPAPKAAEDLGGADAVDHEDSCSEASEVEQHDTESKQAPRDAGFFRAAATATPATVDETGLSTESNLHDLDVSGDSLSSGSTDPEELGIECAGFKTTGEYCYPVELCFSQSESEVATGVPQVTAPQATQSGNPLYPGSQISAQEAVSLLLQAKVSNIFYCEPFALIPAMWLRLMDRLLSV